MTGIFWTKGDDKSPSIKRGVFRYKQERGAI